jgi:hypothetical protein
MDTGRLDGETPGCEAGQAQKSIQRPFFSQSP